MATRAPIIERAERLSRWHPVVDAAAIIGVHPATVYRMKARGWRESSRGQRPIPSDFQIQAKRKTVAELMAHYRAGYRAVRRWLDERPRPRFKPGKVRQQVAL